MVRYYVENPHPLTRPRETVPSKSTNTQVHMNGKITNKVSNKINCYLP